MKIDAKNLITITIFLYALVTTFFLLFKKSCPEIAEKSNNFKSEILTETKTNITNEKVTMKELRIVLTVDNLAETIKFYRDDLGLKTSKEWKTETGQGIILEAGKASLELIDHNHANTIDSIEVGNRVAGPVRLAFNIDHDIENVGIKLEKAGAKKITEVKQAPWSKVQRMEDPSGMQFTLFETSTLFEDK